MFHETNGRHLFTVLGGDDTRERHAAVRLTPTPAIVDAMIARAAQLAAGGSVSDAIDAQVAAEFGFADASAGVAVLHSARAITA